ncbi:hypothetical protein LshimejAT787_1602850 [Lyophyllum shimeji]|uniref:DUF6534 domain-containing protein n=1 Tax=Lyophyllum shimeji TaxID=47721 RepID=A0A9P3PWM8_LYOSH|nr:hypothetical protein LshimejAT787_1602850 [Lyophyllum shimeji]
MHCRLCSIDLFRHTATFRPSSVAFNLSKRSRDLFRTGAGRYSSQWDVVYSLANADDSWHQFYADSSEIGLSGWIDAAIRTAGIAFTERMDVFVIACIQPNVRDRTTPFRHAQDLSHATPRKQELIMAAVPPRIVIDDTFGASFIGVLFTAMLYGITTLQTYFFYVYYPTDRIENKLLVASIWALDTGHMALVSICMYYYLVTNYSNPPALAVGHWSLFTSVAVNVTIAFLVHVFFTVRIFRLSSRRVRWWLTPIISLLVLAHFCFGVETVVFLFLKKRFDKLNEFTLFAAMPFALFAVLSDIFIAAALCVLLYGSRTGFRRTNTLVNTLMVYAINRCVLTSVVATAEVIVFAVSPHSLWFLAIDFVVGKLYANSLLATLNSRRSIAGRGSIQSVHMSDINFEEDSGRADTSTQKGVILDLRGQDSTSSASRTTRPSIASDSKNQPVPSSNDFLSMSL